jgi:hypothetical protein
MKYINKLVLVPIAEWELLKKNPQNPVKQVVQKKNKVSQEKPQIMNQSQAQAQIQNKTEPIQSVMKQTQGIRNMMKNLPTNLNQRGSGTSDSDNHDWIKTHFSKGNKNKLSSLLKYLSNDNLISWNDKGEFIYKGDVIPKSNIIDLIKHSFNNSQYTPKGMNEYYQGLSELNVPHYLVQNEYGKYLMSNDIKKDKSMWKPPGILEASKNISKKHKSRKEQKQKLRKKQKRKKWKEL